jgi:hypothetical protein
MSPFEVFYGRKTNRLQNLLSVGEVASPDEIEVEEEILGEVRGIVCLLSVGL